jgi:site-specific DNA-methyltransferase (adenine-specific)
MIKLELIYGDALKVLPTFPANSIDLVITDPPYGISDYGNSLTKKGTNIIRADFGEWDKFGGVDNYSKFVLCFMSEVSRILKPQAQAYVFFDNHYAGHYTYLIEKETELRQKCPIVIRKINPIPHVRKTNYRSAFEMVILFVKDKNKKCKTFNFLSPEAMVNCLDATIGRKETTHPTEKPLHIIDLFVKVSSNPGDVILDPFLGSGTTMVAARNNGRNCIGIDNNLKYIEMVKKRLMWGTSLGDVEYVYKDMAGG